MKKKSINTILTEVNMFASLEQSDLNALEKISRTYKYVRGETLFTEGEMSNFLMILVEGMVSIFKHDHKGNEIVIGYFEPYSLLAEAPTLRHTPLPSSAKFQRDGVILKIDILAFEKLFITYPNISYGIIQSLLKKVDLLQQNIHFKIASTSSEKILHFYKENPSLSRNLKQYEIASILGIVPETFSRNIRKLVNDNILEKVGKGYRLLIKEKH